LAAPDIEESVVSIDAIGTQRKIAEQIIEQRGHYFLSVRGNQQGPPDDLEHAFKVDNAMCIQIFFLLLCFLFSV
jgi:predicted transposase YbfD/YdcC